MRRSRRKRSGNALFRYFGTNFRHRAHAHTHVLYPIARVLKYVIIRMVAVSNEFQ